MIDKVNTDERVEVHVRPFMSLVLVEAEARLEAKKENAPTSWDQVRADRLMNRAVMKAAEAEYDVMNIRDMPEYSEGAKLAAKKRIADAINFLGMAYDTIDQM